MLQDRVGIDRLRDYLRERLQDSTVSTAGQIS
jgi:hypothetical protein